jgi:hypothetical protein
MIEMLIHELVFLLILLSYPECLVSRYRLQYHNPPPFSAHEVLPGIWLGNFEDSLQADELRRRNVTHILSVAVGLYPHHQALVPDAQVCFVFAFALFSLHTR